MKLRILLFIFVSTSLGAMEGLPRKRSAQEVVEQDAPKTPKVTEEIIYPLASLPGLPNELQVTIAGYLLDAPGQNNYKLLNAANNIRNLFMLNKRYQQLLDDVDLSGNIIKELARRYTNNDLVHAAITFNTNAASKWLAHFINQSLVGPDGSILPLESLQGDARNLYEDIQRALDFAINNNRLDIVRFLLAHQPKLADWHVNSIRFNVSDKFPLLEIALYKQDPQLVGILFRAGAQITDAIVTSAAANDSTFPLKQLKDVGTNLNTLYDGESLFHFATSEDVIKYLVEQGVPIDTENTKGVTALQQAIYSAQFSIANLLLKYGADPNIQNDFGDRALHSALIKKAPVQTVELIVSKMTSLDSANDDGNTPLALSILGYDLASIELLLSRGAHLPPLIYEPGVHGNMIAVSPLAYVLRMAQHIDPPVLIKITDLLLAHGANPNEIITDPNSGVQRTLLSYLQNSRFSWMPLYRNIIAILKGYGAHE